MKFSVQRNDKKKPKGLPLLFICKNLYDETHGNRIFVVGQIVC